MKKFIYQSSFTFSLQRVCGREAFRGEPSQFLPAGPTFHADVSLLSQNTHRKSSIQTFFFFLFNLETTLVKLDFFFFFLSLKALCSLGKLFRGRLSLSAYRSQTPFSSPILPSTAGITGVTTSSGCRQHNTGQHSIPHRDVSRLLGVYKQPRSQRTGKTARKSGNTP